VVPYSAKKLMLFTHVALRTKSKGAPDQYFTHLLLLSARASPRTKSKGLLIGGHLLSKKTYAFYTRSTTYKSKGAPDQRSTHLLLLSTHASPRTKSKGFHRCVLQIYYFINQVFKSFCSPTCMIIDGLALP
jgi:hypothetical protein